MGGVALHLSVLHFWSGERSISGSLAPKGPLVFRIMARHSSAIPAEEKSLFFCQVALIKVSGLTDYVRILEPISVAKGWGTRLAGYCSLYPVWVQGLCQIHRICTG